MAREISYQDFEKIDIRVGRIIAVDDFPEAGDSRRQLPEEADI